MNPQSPHFQSQAVAILAIATAVIGFGLFGAEFLTGSILWSSSVNGALARLKFLLAMAAVACYVIIMLFVGKIMRQDEVTGEQVANGPLLLTCAETVYVGLIFLVGILEEPQP